MQIRSVLKIAIAFFVLTIGLIAPALASNNQSNQAIDRPATLISPEPSFEIKVYPKPSRSPKRIGFGLGGDRLTLIEQVGSNEGDTWDYVRFENPKQVEGWVKDEFVVLQENNSSAPSRQNAQQPMPRNSSQNRYQGTPQQSYRQQNQYP